MKKRRLVYVLACVILVFNMASCTAESEAATGTQPGGIKMSAPSGEETLFAEDDSFSLWVNEATSEVVIKDGEVRYPVFVPEDEAINSGTLLKLQSHLVVEFINENNSRSEANSKVSAVNRNTYLITKIKNGVRITFDFSRDKEQFVIPVDYTIENRSLTVSVQGSEIVEYGKNRIASFSLLPGFLSGRPVDNGAVILPDGSGALVDFSVKNSGMAALKLPVYGRDPALSLSKVSSDKEVCRMPVFGVTKGENGILGILEKGEALTNIVCQPAKADSPVTYVYPEFLYRALDTVTLADQSFKAKDSTLSARKPEASDYSVTYMFETGKPGYESLALRYRDFLNQGNLPEAPKRGLFIDAYGAVKKKSTFLGIVYDKLEAVTTFDQLSEMAGLVKSNGSPPLSFLLSGFQKGGYGGTAMNAKMSGVTGGNSGLSELIKKTDTGGVYIGAQLSADTKTRLFGPYVRSIFNEVVSRNTYSLALGKKLEDKAVPLFKAEKALKNAQAFLDSCKQKASGAYLSDMGSELYSDYDKDNPLGRNMYQESQEALLKKAGGQKLALKGANAYAAIVAYAVTDVPLADSGYLLTAQAIPFMQIAFSGITDLVARPLNGSPDMEASFIRAAALGMSISFRFTGKENFDFKDTAISFLSNTCYKNWTEEIKTYSGRMSEVSAKIGSSAITACEMLGTDAYRVTYSNGVAVIANAGTENVTWNGREVPGKSINFES